MSQVDSAAAVFVWRFGDAEFDEASRELRVAGSNVDLEPRPLEILLQLLRHAGEVVTKADLLDAVYGHRHLSDGALAQGVRRLRRALNDDDQKVVATVHRVGYKLIAQVRRTEISGRRPRPSLLKAGDRVPRRDHWRLLEPLGGTEAEVWLIEHEKTHVRRVLKLATDARRLSALKREVTLSRVLRDGLGERDDLVALIDWNFDETPYFIECAYGGVTMVEWGEAQGGLAGMPLTTRVDMIARAAEAVGAAHGANVLHKDLKPTNILAFQAPDASWRARLIDFGSGRLLDADRLAALRITQQGFTQTVLTGEDSMSGTPFYLAPELLAGQMPTVQSDVYSLGVILYQAVAGDFHKPIASGWEDDVADPLLREDIAYATHGNPAKRMGSASDLAQRLRRLDARRLVHRPQPLPAKSRGARVSALLALAAVGIALVAWQIRRYQHPDQIGMAAVASQESIDAYQHVLTVSHQRHESMSDQLDSVRTLAHAVALSPRFANAWALLARENSHIYFNHYETEKSRAAATRALQKAVELQPNSPDTLIAQGYYSYWIEADYAAAGAAMLRVHRLWPENQDADVALARIARRQDHYADAAKYFEEALARDRFNMELVLGAADARLALQQYQAALKLANHALDIDPADVQAIGLKASVYQEQGDLENAAAALQALPNRLGDYASVSLLTEQARLARRFPAAIALWSTYLAGPESRSDDDENTAQQELAHLLLLTGNGARAVSMLKGIRDDLERKRANRSADPRPVGDLALVYADLGEPALARTLAQSAASFEVVRNDAARTSIFDVIRARVAVRTGDKDQAIEILRRSLTRRSKGAVTPGLLSIDPEWDALRSDPRFSALTQQTARIAFGYGWPSNGASVVR